MVQLDGSVSVPDDKDTGLDSEKGRGRGSAGGKAFEPWNEGRKSLGLIHVLLWTWITIITRRGDERLTRAQACGHPPFDAPDALVCKQMSCHVRAEG